MSEKLPGRRAARYGALAAAWLLCVALVHAQTAQVPAKPRVSTAKPARTAPPHSPDSAQASGKGYRIAPRPAWVVDPPASTDISPATTDAGSGARREVLIDEQVNYTLPKVQASYRLRAVATDASTLGSVSQPQIRFNPAFHTVSIHDAHVVRDGRKLDRLKDARIELMRRETQLERQVIDGTETLLVVLSDVRVGETVEISYTIEGSNPIFEGRISDTFHAGGETPIDLLHQRVVAPSGRSLQLRSVGGDVMPERSVEGAQQVFRLVRTKVPGQAAEALTPPWFKVYPAWQISEFKEWADVDQWARRLFVPAPGDSPMVKARAEALRATGLKDEALVAEALRFVQDEVRYFSISLGENSHRPKSAERTLADRLGDCKDKTVLLNALLFELGFDARPALASIQRNRGIASYLPSSDQFDHVITQVEVNGKHWFIDSTITGQGTTLAERGRYAYGHVLVIGAGQALTPVPEPAEALNQVDHEQLWDYAKPGAPVGFTSVTRAHGATAERWRAAVAQVGQDRIVDGVAGAHMRAVPGLKLVGTPTLRDDRKANVLELRVEFEHPLLGTYVFGGLDAEFGAVELLDTLQGPPEARRRTTFMLEQPRVATSRIEVRTPRLPPNNATLPAGEVNDRHFRFQYRVETMGATAVFTRRIERKTDEVLPPDLASFRENLNRARALVGNRVRMLFFDTQNMAPEFERIDRRMRTEVGGRQDQLYRIVMRNHVNRALDDQALRGVVPGSALEARVLASRAMAGNLLADFAGSLADADRALRSDPTLEEALEARAVSLIGQGRLDEAVEALRKLDATPRRLAAVKWLAAVEVHRGQHSAAEPLLREVIANGSGDDRDFALLWLYVAAEHQGRRGKAAIAPYVEAADPKKLVGAMLHYFDGRLDREALLQRAREDATMERLNLAEAYFFIGQQFAAQGQPDEARRWYSRTVETKALPYREHTFARLELQRAR
jgi:tetratricopeptide (TPR) repeat protein